MHQCNICFEYSFYGAVLWHCFHTSVLQHLETAYVKCIKCFWFDRGDSVIAMVYKLGLPTFRTIVHNANLTTDMQLLQKHSDVLIRHLCACFCYMNHVLMYDNFCLFSPSYFLLLLLLLLLYVVFCVYIRSVYWPRAQIKV